MEERRIPKTKTERKSLSETQVTEMYEWNEMLVTSENDQHESSEMKSGETTRPVAKETLVKSIRDEMNTRIDGKLVCFWKSWMKYLEI